MKNTRKKRSALYSASGRGFQETYKKHQQPHSESRYRYEGSWCFGKRNGFGVLSVGLLQFHCFWYNNKPLGKIKCITSSGDVFMWFYTQGLQMCQDTILDSQGVHHRVMGHSITSTRRYQQREDESRECESKVGGDYQVASALMRLRENAFF